MSATLLPHIILSRLEDSKCNHFMAELAALANRHNQLMSELEASALRHLEIEKCRHRPHGHGIKASELAVLETARHEETSLKDAISGQLLALKEEEKELKQKILASMNKSGAYGSITDKENRVQKRKSAHTEQKAVDDLMANRCIQRH